MDGYKFEKKCAATLRRQGFTHVTLTGGSGDQGVDILAQKRRKKYGIQCKYYTHPVGNNAVQQAYAGARYYECDVAAVMTNSTYTSAARELAERTDVRLWQMKAGGFGFWRHYWWVSLSGIAALAFCLWMLLPWCLPQTAGIGDLLRRLYILIGRESILTAASASPAQVLHMRRIEAILTAAGGCMALWNRRTVPLPLGAASAFLVSIGLEIAIREQMAYGNPTNAVILVILTAISLSGAVARVKPQSDHLQ